MGQVLIRDGTKFLCGDHCRVHLARIVGQTISLNVMPTMSASSARSNPEGILDHMPISQRNCDRAFTEGLVTETV